MRNRWTVERETVLEWVARLPAAAHPDLLEWRRQAVAAGADFAVYRVAGAERLPDDPGAPFDHHHTATSRIAFADAGGAVVEDEIEDLGLVLAAAPYAAPVRHRPPLRVDTGFGTGLGAGSGVEFWASISTCSDIWLPWSSARYEEDAEPEDFSDNRELADLHTPRLNAFLARLREVTVAMGGSWALERDTTDRALLFELGDSGVLLDAENPLERPEWNWVDGRSTDDLTDALRRARQSLDLDPSPPPYRAVLRAIVEHPENPLYRADRGVLLDALRRSPNPLRATELDGIAAVQIDNREGRFAFAVTEIVG